jgi:hypothetical protein
LPRQEVPPVRARLLLLAYRRWGYPTGVLVHAGFNAAGFYLLPLILR